MNNFPARYQKALRAYERIRDKYPSDSRRRMFYYVRLLRAERAIYKQKLDKAVIRKEIVAILASNNALYKPNSSRA